MLRATSDLKGYSILATDGPFGSVDDLYFDDEHWTVRYLVVDTGGWLSGRRVLISPIALKGVDTTAEQVEVNLTKGQVENSPDIAVDQPVARQHEIAYYNYYGWPYYWPGPYVWGAGMYPGALAATPAQQTADLDEEQQEGDPHLRSVNEVTGYHIRATDDEIGHVDDLIVDDESWEVRYLVVDTSNWWFGKKVLVAPQWAEHVDWSTREVTVGLRREDIQNGPEWDPDALPDRDYEERLHGHYDRRGYWADR